MKKYISLFVLLAVLLLAGCGAKAEDSTAAGIPPELTVSGEEAYTAVKDDLTCEDYISQLGGYLDRLTENANDKAALISAIRCQIMLGETELAEHGIALLQQMSPREAIIPELYVDMAEVTGETGYSLTALSIARETGNEAFLEKVPAAPHFSEEEGVFDRKLSLEISSSADADIVYSLDNDYNYITETYSGPARLSHGKNTVSAYACRGYYVSDTVTAVYYCNYKPTPVSFIDPGMEQIVRSSLGIPEGQPLTDVDCEGVQEVYYSPYESPKVLSLEDLDKLPNLSYLRLYQITLTDYSPIAKAKNLYQLVLGHTNVSDLGFLRELPSLQYFTAYNNREIVDLEPIYDSTNLYGLDFYSNAADVQLDYSRLTHLKQLTVECDKVTDWSVLLSMDDLQSLYLEQGLRKVDTSVLGKLKSLKVLSCYGDSSVKGDRLEDLSFLKELTELEQLSLYNVNDIDQLMYVTELKNLVYLTMSNCSDLISQSLLETLRAALPGCTINA